MSGESGALPPLAALRHAGEGLEERFLVGVADAAERARVLGGLGSEVPVFEQPTTAGALALLADESFDLAILERTPGGQAQDPLSTSREMRPFTDLVLISNADPIACAAAFAREVAAILPRPLPESDALLRAHLRWLVSCRRSRTRGLLIANAYAGIRADLAAADPALAASLEEMLAESARDPAAAVLGDVELGRAAGAGDSAATPEVVVVGVGAADQVEGRLAEARARASAAAVIVVDEGGDAQRFLAAIYGGARAYLPRASLPLLGRIVASVASRRKAELLGRKLVETLARHRVLDEQRTPRPAAVHTRDVDARLMHETTAAGKPFVPSGHEVLVVDDEAVVLTVLREALRRGGYRVTTAASAEEAIELMRARKFDLVLTDKNLPGASGLDVLRAAKTLDPSPAIVLITGYSSYDSAVMALDIGAHDYIEKPIRDVDDLRFRIRRALSRRDEQMARPRPTPGAGRPRVLLVAEEGERGTLMADYLSRTYVVTLVRTGQEALEALKSARHDIVLADRNLPGVNGLRVIEQAREFLPHCASVLYTGYPSYDTVKEAFALGVDAFLAHPNEDLKLLGEKVAGALAGRGGILLG